MTTKRVYLEDFYQTTITSESISSSGDVSFTVGKSIPNGSRGWIIISPDDANLRERMYFYNSNGSTLYVRGTGRFTAKAHTLGEVVKMNDISNIYDFFSDISSSAFYIEKISGTTVNVWGGDILKDNVTTTVNDTELTLPNGQVSYIYFDKDDNSISYSNSESGALNSNGVIVADVTCSLGAVSSIIPRNYKFSTFTIAQGPQGEKGENGDIGTPGPDGQTISDNVPMGDGDTIDIIGETIKITRSNGVYTIYTETEITTYDSTGAPTSVEIKTGTFADSIMTYSDGMTVNGVSGLISFTGSPAYRNKSNTFTANNTFEGDTVFEGRVSFGYYEITPVGSTYTFDGRNGTKQVMNVPSGGTMTINFDYLFSGANYEFVINNNTGGDVTISKGTITNSDSIVNFYSVGGTAFCRTTNVIGTGTHLFICEAYSTAIHISYIGESQGIA